MNTLRQKVYALRERPVRERKAILISTTVGLTALIVLVWVTAISMTGGNYRATNRNTKDVESPFAILKNNVVELYANTIDGYNSATK